MSIPFRGTYTPKNLLASDQLVRRGLGMTDLHANALGFGAVALSAAAFGLWRWNRGLHGAVEWAAIAGLAALLSFFQWWRVVAAFRTHPLAWQEAAGTIGGEGITTTRSDARIETSWSDLVAWTATAEQLLLLGRGHEVYAFPRSFFATEAEFADATSLASARLRPLPRRPIVKTVLVPALLWLVGIALLIALWTNLQK